MEGFQSLLILMVVIWVGGKIFRALTLPVIFGELLGGIIIGPLVFNVIDPNSEMIITLAELGIFFLMLHSGLEANPQKLLNASKKSVLVAICGLLVPFSGAFLVAQLNGLDLYQSLFIATGLSATAIAISVRVFKDCKLQGTKVANTVLGAAILSDIILLVLFAMILRLNELGNIDAAEIALMFGKIVLFFVVVIFAGLKLQKYTKNLYKDKGFTITLIVALALGLIAESIGLHMIIGAFLAGLFIREEVIDEKVFKKIEDRVYGLSYSFLGPIFFATLAFHLDFAGLLANPYLLIGLFVAAFFGKFFGSALAAYFQKIQAKKSVIIGLAMNSRGAVDLVIASIGLEVGLITREIFSIMVFIAFLSTLVAILGMRIMKRTMIKTV